jgi:hypothetical protein
LESKGFVWNFCGLDSDLNQRQGVLCNCSDDFLIWDLFSRGELRGLGSRPMDHGTKPVHHGPWTGEAAVARWSAYSQPVWATVARRDMGKMERGVRHCRGDAHRSLDDNEMVAEHRFLPVTVWAR